MLIRPNITNMFHELNAKHFAGEIPVIPVVWNTRMTTTAGYARYKRIGGRWSEVIEPTKIELSDKLFNSLGYPISKIERTLIHEMVHAFLFHKHNEPGHTRRFNNIMNRITGEYKNHRCHSYDTSKVRRKNTKKVKCICTKCGYEYRKARMPKYAGRSVYRHRNCGGEVEFSLDANGCKSFGEPNKISIF